MFLVGVLALLFQNYRAVFAVIGSGTIVVLLAMVCAGLLAGYLLGGEGCGNRTTLAFASAARHPGVAIAVVTTSFPDARLAPAAILLYAILNVVATIPLMRSATTGAAER